MAQHEDVADAPAPPLRADAERNRQRIIDAARALFGRHGIDVPLEDVAREAGVGIGTLYRRFPTRAELTAATFAQMISPYLAAIESAAVEPDAWAGITRLVHELCELQAADPALRDLMTMRFPESPELERLTNTAEARLEDMFGRARAAGTLRPDAEIGDLVLLLLGNAEITRRTSSSAPEAWRRYAALQLDALRAGPRTSLLPAGPAPEQLVAALRH